MIEVKKMHVVIIGAGSMGAFFDNPTCSVILTHAHSFVKHDGFELVGFVDIDETRAMLAAEIWGGKGYETLRDAYRDNPNIDIVVIAVADKFHYSMLKEVYFYRPRLVFLEKPFAKSYDEANEIKELYSDIPVLVNYSRRFVPEFEVLRDKIHSGYFGEYISGYGQYGKGVLHNGSHIFDLLRMLIGEIKDGVPAEIIHDQYDDDPSIAGSLFFDSGKSFNLLAVDCNLYSIFELDLLFEKGRVRILDSGLEIEEYIVGENILFKGYYDLVLGSKYETSYGLALYNAADNIKKYLENSESLKCTVTDGIRAMEVALDLRVPLLIA